MACEDSTDIDAALIAAAQGPAEVTSDGLTVKGHRLTDLIEADRYVNEKCATGRRTRGIRFTKLVPPGAP